MNFPGGSGSAGEREIPRIFAFAYACEPKKGSEPGAGWTWARMLARDAHVWIATRANNRAAIEARLPSTPERDRMHFVYIDLPPWARRWKRGARGLRLYYLLWQVAAARAGRRLHRELSFDVVWHLTLANAWLGSMAPTVPATFVYGPVGGGVGAPWRLSSTLGARGITYEMARSAVRALTRYANPLARLAWNRAHLILVQNPETRAWLPRRHRAKAMVFPHAVLEDAPPIPAVERTDGSPTALFAGRVVPWKGVALALEAIARLPEWHFVVCGSGPDEHRLKKLARRLGIADRVTFTGWLSRAEVLARMATADAFLFPSLHDDAPFAIAEARTCGLPVVCVERGGPPILGGAGVPYERRSTTVAGLAASLGAASRRARDPALLLDSVEESLAAAMHSRKVLSRERVGQAGGAA